ncbi:MAG: DUF2335 domain-containing protein [Bacteroidales bacterium]|nr:DUF2335 domain-containing protein [Bacteroidales bacterium]
MENSNKPVEVATIQHATEKIQEPALTPEDILLDMIPEPRKEEAKSIIKAMVVMQEESFSGPIPPPAILRQYEDLQSGAADRILRMAEKQSEHRMELEKKAIGGQVEQSRRGQTFGLIIVVLFMLVAFAFAYFFNMTSFAATFLSVTMVIIVVLFVSGKVLTIEDLKDKSKNQDK